MMDGLAAAILAGGMANLAASALSTPANSVLAMDGAQIHTDAEGKTAVGAFDEVFAKAMQPVAGTETPVNLKLPELPVIPPVIAEETASIELENEIAAEEPVELVLDVPNLPMPVQPVSVEPPLEVEAVEQHELPKLTPIEESKIELPAEVTLVDDHEVAEQPVTREVKAEFTISQPQVMPKEVEVAVKLAPPPILPERQFVETNHPTIVSEIRGRLLPDGGSMHIRLDPPELGALAVQIDVRDGFVTASFQTSNDEATRLLSHSLGQLRHTLETQGVSVEKLQVQQTPREQFTSNSNSHDRERAPGQQAYERSAQDDQQRREMLQRMWKRLTVGHDMLDLVA
jgi:hypothetical protein